MRCCLKSFLKILIGVQYHCIAINPGMPAEYPQKRQSFRLHRYFRCGWPLVCGRQDSITLWSTRRKRRVATVHRTVAFTWVRARRLYQNKKGARRLLFILVRATGLEPARLRQRNLNPPSLPIPPRPHVACNRVILSWEPGNVNGRQPEPLKFPGGKGQFSQFLLSLSLTFRQGACKISQVWCTLPGRKRPEGVSFLSGLAGVCVLRPMLAFCFFNSLGEPPSANCHAQFHMGISATPSAPILRRRCVFRLWNGI